MIRRVLFVGALLAGCDGAGAPPLPVPPLMTETMPKPPVSAEQLIWQPGHWNWTGSSYVWAPGQFVPMSDQGTKWMPGHWTRGDQGWAWNPPHWTR